MVPHPSNRSPSMPLLLVLLVIAATALSAAPADAQTAVPVACPATFSVLHDDRIGTLAVPAGSYALTVADPARLSCAQAADRFRQFLEDWDGRLPAPWTLDAATATFSGGTGIGFRIAAVAAPSGGGGGQYPATGARCPDTFQVLHDDRIGALVVPAGSYTVTLTSVGSLSCARAMNRFAAFLRDFDGRLPRPWVLQPQTATFLEGGHDGRVPGRARRHAGAGARGRRRPPRRPALPGHVQRAARRPDRPAAPAAGRYRITLAAAGRPSCSLSARYLARFLRRPNGRLPGPWRVDPATGTFTQGPGTGFRIKPIGRCDDQRARHRDHQRRPVRRPPPSRARARRSSCSSRSSSSFLAIRTSARMTRSVSWWPGGIETGGVHIHHLVLGHHADDAVRVPRVRRAAWRRRGGT